jgi:hypothetical protein
MSVKKKEYLPFVSTWVHSRFFVGIPVAYFLVFCAVILCVFTFWVPCYDVRSDLKEKTMFGSSLPPVVHRMAYVLFAFSLCLCALVVSITYRVVFWLCFSSSSVPYIASFSGFPFLITPSVFSNVYFLKD